MINLTTLFKNHFDTKSISDDKLKVFSEDHIQRINVNNGSGLFTAIMNDTVAAHTAYFGNITGEATNKAIQKSRTASVDNIISTFKEEVSRREGLIKSLFGKDSATYLEFFPLGIKEYSSAIKANVETLINRMVNVANVHAAEAGNDFINAFTNIQTNYMAARSAQLSKIGEVKANKTTTKTTRNALEIQLTKNLHYIGYTYPADEARCLSFFDQSVIHYRQSSATDGLGRITGVITNAATKEPVLNAEIEITGTDIPKAHTDAEGKYRSRNVATGIYEVSISKQGYQTATVSKEIIDDGNTAMNVELTATV